MAYAEALPAALPAAWDLLPPASESAQHRPPADDTQPPAAVKALPSSDKSHPAEGSGGEHRAVHEGKQPKQGDNALRNSSPSPFVSHKPAAGLPHNHPQQHRSTAADVLQEHKGTDFVTIDSANSFETGGQPPARDHHRHNHRPTLLDPAACKRGASTELPAQSTQAADAAGDSMPAAPPAKRQKSAPLEGAVHAGNAKVVTAAHDQLSGQKGAGKAPAQPAAAPSGKLLSPHPLLLVKLALKLWGWSQQIDTSALLQPI